MAHRDLKITTITKPLEGGEMWSGTAISGGKNWQWFYTPRGRLCIREEEARIPNCFMNIDTPSGVRRRIVNAVRSASSHHGKDAS
jgi:hypothetical protein